MNIHQKMKIFFEKTMKPYFKAVILSLYNYEHILNFKFLISLIPRLPPPAPPPIKHIDCLRKFFEAVIYRCKRYTNSWVHENTFESTLISVNELDAKR